MSLYREFVLIDVVVACVTLFVLRLVFHLSLETTVLATALGFTFNHAMTFAITRGGR